MKHVTLGKNHVWLQVVVCCVTLRWFFMFLKKCWNEKKSCMILKIDFDLGEFSHFPWIGRRDGTRWWWIRRLWKNGFSRGNQEETKVANAEQSSHGPSHGTRMFFLAIHGHGLKFIVFFCIGKGKYSIFLEYLWVRKKPDFLSWNLVNKRDKTWQISVGYLQYQIGARLLSIEHNRKTCSVFA